MSSGGRERRSKRTPVRFDPNLPPQQSQLVGSGAVKHVPKQQQSTTPTAATHGQTNCEMGKSVAPAAHAPAKYSAKKKATKPNKPAKPVRKACERCGFCFGNNVLEEEKQKRHPCEKCSQLLGTKGNDSRSQLQGANSRSKPFKDISKLLRHPNGQSSQEKKKRRKTESSDSKNVKSEQRSMPRASSSNNSHDSLPPFTFYNKIHTTKQTSQHGNASRLDECVNHITTIARRQNYK